MGKNQAPKIDLGKISNLCDFIYPCGRIFEDIWFFGSEFHRRGLRLNKIGKEHKHHKENFTLEEFDYFGNIVT